MTCHITLEHLAYIYIALYINHIQYTGKVETLLACLVILFVVFLAFLLEVTTGVGDWVKTLLVAVFQSYCLH